MTTTRETADHIGEANGKAIADHAELARLAWRAKAAVLRSRGKANSLHDIEQAADYLDAAASVRSSHAPDLDRLAQIAEAATQGVWTVDAVRAHQAVRTSIVSGLTVIARIFEGKPKRAEANAAFIAAANPAAVLALLSEIAALRGEVERVQRECDEMALHGFQAVQAERQRDELRKALERLASSEAFETPRVIDGPLAPEMRARMSYARQVLANQGADQ